MRKITAMILTSSLLLGACTSIDDVQMAREDMYSIEGIQHDKKVTETVYEEPVVEKLTYSELEGYTPKDELYPNFEYRGEALNYSREMYEWLREKQHDTGQLKIDGLTTHSEGDKVRDIYDIGRTVQFTVKTKRPYEPSVEELEMYKEQNKKIPEKDDYSLQEIVVTFDGERAKSDEYDREYLNSLQMASKLIKPQVLDNDFIKILDRLKLKNEKPYEFKEGTETFTLNHQNIKATTEHLHEEGKHFVRTTFTVIEDIRKSKNQSIDTNE